MEVKKILPKCIFLDPVTAWSLRRASGLFSFSNWSRINSLTLLIFSFLLLSIERGDPWHTKNFHNWANGLMIFFHEMFIQSRFKFTLRHQPRMELLRNESLTWISKKKYLRRCGNQNEFSAVREINIIIICKLTRSYVIIENEPPFHGTKINRIFQYLGRLNNVVLADAKSNTINYLATWLRWRLFCSWIHFILFG